MRNFAWKGHRWNSTDLIEETIVADSLEEATRELRRQSYIVQTIEPCDDIPETAEEALRQHLILNPEKTAPDWFRSANQPRPKPPSAWQSAWASSQSYFSRLSHRFLSWLHQQNWSTHQRVQFHLQLGQMLESGVPLSRAIDTQRQHSDNPWVQEKLRNLLASGDYGQALISSELFQPFELAQLKVALESGTLAQTHLRLAAQGEKALRYRRAFFSRMLQPLITLAVLYLLAPIVGYLVGTLLLCVADLRESPSLLTQAGPLLTSRWWLLAAWSLPILLVFAGYRGLQRRMGATRKADLLKLPGIGRIWWNFDMAQGLGTFANLIEGGFPIHQALKLTQQISFSDCWTRMLEAASQGEPLSTALAGPFDPTQERSLQKAIRAGEESGTLPKLCLNLQTGLEAEATYQLDQLFHLLEPLVGMSVAGLVCGLCVLVLSPLREILQSL